MPTPKELNTPTVLDEANETVEAYTRKRVLRLRARVNDVMLGKATADKVKKEQLCKRMNSWVRWLNIKKKSYPQFRVDQESEEIILTNPKRRS